MLHEALMILLGNSDSLLGDVDKKLASYGSLLHQSDCIILKRIYHVARQYKNIMNFVNGTRSGDIFKKNSLDEASKPKEYLGVSKGIYLEAFSEGLDEVLGPYRDCIMELEYKILRDSQTPITLIASEAEQYLKLFEILNSMIKEIVEQKYHGSAIIVLVYRFLRNEVGEVAKSINRILYGCHRVFITQLTHWLLYGDLPDNYKEFFIQNKTELDDSQNSWMSCQTGQSMYDQDQTKINNHLSFSNYEIQSSSLPPYITPSVAKKILSIGQLMLIFKSDPKMNSDLKIFSCDHITSIWEGKEKNMIAKFWKLQSIYNFNILEFDNLVEEIRVCVTEHLWNIAVKDTELFLQLRLIKDFFLLGRGDLFLEFIRQADGILGKPPSSNTKRLVNHELQAAANKTALDDHMADKFYFFLPSKTDATGPSQETGWQLMHLRYKVSWPLHLLFTPEALDNYDLLFCFLLRVKKTQVDLHSIWSSHMFSKSGGMSENSPPVCQLRNNLMFVVDNLQFYLQVDVLESQYALLQNAVKSTKDFEKVQKAHTIFQANILSQSFLLKMRKDVYNSTRTQGAESPVYETLTELLDLSDKFCCHARVWGHHLSEVQNQDLQTMVNEFKQRTLFLVQLLSSLRFQPCGSHLSQLLLRLNFNRWFTREHGTFAANDISF